MTRLALLGGCLCLTAWGAVPVLEHLHPAGAVPGSSNTVAVSGKFDPWPVEAWVDAPGVTFTAQTNRSRFTVEIATNALPGPRLVRLFNAEASSDPRIFVVDDGPTLAESEPNNRFTAPQSVTNLPVTIHGRLDQNGDVDSYAVRLQAGEWLEARLDAYTLMSKVDAVFRLVTTNGLSLAWNHDWNSLDPRLTWRAPTHQTVVLQVFGFKYPADASVQLTGGEGAVYSLHLAATPTAPREDDTGTPELEPNDTAAAAPLVQLPVTLRGTIGADGDEDRYRFVAAKDLLVEAHVEAAGLGSPLDAWLRIEDLAGKELAANDDAEGSADPRLTWRAPSDGTNVLVVGSTVHRGGPDYRYWLSLVRAEPGFQGLSAVSGFVLNAGETNEIKVAIRRRNGHTNELQVSLRDLPPGVTAATATAPAGDGEVALKLIATPAAAPFGGPVSVVLVDGVAHREEPVYFDLVSRGENNGVPQGWSRLLVERTKALWLTVRPKAAAAPAK